MSDDLCATCHQKKFEPHHYVGGNPEVGWIRCRDPFHPINDPAPEGQLTPEEAEALNDG